MILIVDIAAITEIDGNCEEKMIDCLFER